MFTTLLALVKAYQSIFDFCSGHGKMSESPDARGIFRVCLPTSNPNWTVAWIFEPHTDSSNVE